MKMMMSTVSAGTLPEQSLNSYGDDDDDDDQGESSNCPHWQQGAGLGVQWRSHQKISAATLISHLIIAYISSGSISHLIIRYGIQEHFNWSSCSFLTLQCSSWTWKKERKR